MLPSLKPALWQALFALAVLLGAAALIVRAPRGLSAVLAPDPWDLVDLGRPP